MSNEACIPVGEIFFWSFFDGFSTCPQVLLACALRKCGKVERDQGSFKFSLNPLPSLVPRVS